MFAQFLFILFASISKLQQILTVAMTEYVPYDSQFGISGNRS